MNSIAAVLTTVNYPQANAAFTNLCPSHISYCLTFCYFNSAIPESCLPRPKSVRITHTITGHFCAFCIRSFPDCSGVIITGCDVRLVTTPAENMIKPYARLGSFAGVDQWLLQGRQFPEPTHLVCCANALLHVKQIAL